MAILTLFARISVMTGFGIIIPGWGVPKTIETKTFISLNVFASFMMRVFFLSKPQSDEISSAVSESDCDLIRIHEQALIGFESQTTTLLVFTSA